MPKNAVLNGTSKSVNTDVFVNPEAVEVTLCNSPAVPGAKFYFLQSAPAVSKPKIGQQDRAEHNLGIPTYHSGEHRQAFGYVSIPWVIDYYGSVMTPDAVQRAQNTFMKNLVQGNSWAKTGVGEEHYLFFDNAYPITSVIDYTGSIGGIPGAWWFGVQVTDQAVWDKIMSGEYTGFSLTSYTSFKWLGSSRTVEEIGKRMPNLSSIKGINPEATRQDGMKTLGIYTFPSTSDGYADSVNNRLPIDVPGRALAVLDYLTGSALATRDGGYSKEEYKTVLTRTVQALQAQEVILPDACYTKLGLEVPKKDEETQAINIESFESFLGRSDSMPESSAPALSQALVINQTAEAATQEEGQKVILNNQVQPVEESTRQVFAMPVGVNPLFSTKQSVEEITKKQLKGDKTEMDEKVITQAVTDAVGAAKKDIVAEVLQALAERDAKAKEEAARAIKEAEAATKAQTEGHKAIINAVTEALQSMGVVKQTEEKTEAEKLADDMNTAQTAVNEGLALLQSLTAKLGQIAPNRQTVGVNTPKQAAAGTAPAAPKLRTITLPNGQAATAEDIAFLQKWRVEQGFDLDPIEENAYAAFKQGILPSQAFSAVAAQ